VNDVGQSEASVPTEFVIATTPGAPSAPVKTVNTITSVTLQWTAPDSDGASPIRDYQVYMDEGDGSGFISLGLTGSGSTLQYQ
jgi:hypothetical protein